MITILSGSPRANSNTIKVAKAIAKLIKTNHPAEEIEIVDFNGYDIPNFNQKGLDVSNLSPWQSHLVNSMTNSHLIFVLTPEYNWMPSAEILQMLHAFGGPSFKSIWDNKVFATCGTSSGRGGRMPAVQLNNIINKILSVFDFESFVSAKMFESQFSSQVVDEEGNSLGNLEYDKGLANFVNYNLNVAKKWSV